MHSVWFLPILSTVLTLAIGAGLWLVHRRLTKTIEDFAHVLRTQVLFAENSLRSHVVDEVDQLQSHTTSLYANTLHRISSAEASITKFLYDHADTLHKHAEDLRNHAKELSDRAEVSSTPPRQAVTRN